MSAPPSVKGWCPSGLRLMQTGDGWLMRLRPDGSALTAAQARTLAMVAGRCGNGLIDLTSHANVQLRGIDVRMIAMLRETLSEAGLICDGAPDDRGSIVISPLAGRDRAASIDICPAAAALRKALADDPWLDALPDKFTFVIEDDGLFDLSALPADIRFAAFRRDGEPCFAVSIAGPDGAIVLGDCRPDDVAQTASGLARCFMHLRGDTDGPRRIRDLVARIGKEALMRGLDPPLQALIRAANAIPLALQRDEGRCHDARIRSAHDGIGAMGDDILGVAAPFGRLDAVQLSTVADLGTHLHITPWRALLVSGVRDDPATIMASLADRGFITRPDDPRLRIAACPGAPHCDCGSTPTQADAAILAAVLPSNVSVHVSGCAKGCARAAASAVTIVGRAGRYDLVRDGRAGDPPLRHGLTIATVIDELCGRGEAA